MLDEDDDIEGDIKMSTLKGSKPSAGAAAAKKGSGGGGAKMMSYADSNDDEEDSYFTTVKGGDKNGFGALASGENDEDYGLADD